MLAIGKNAVLESIKSKRAEKVLIQKNYFNKDSKEISELAKNNGIKVFFEEKAFLDKLSGGANHQGIIAKTPDFSYSSLEEIINPEGNNFILVLDELSDPHNFGNIIRSAECAGVTGIIIPERRSVDVTETVIKVSVGACFHIKIAKVKNLNDAVRALKDNFITVYSLDMDGKSIYEERFDDNAAFVIGSEGFGIKKLTKQLSDKVLSIPQFGKINSLNAGSATAIAIYEYVRQVKI